MCLCDVIKGMCHYYEGSILKILKEKTQNNKKEGRKCQRGLYVFKKTGKTLQVLARLLRASFLKQRAEPRSHAANALSLNTTPHRGPAPYHLAADGGLQGIHQLGGDADEVVVVGLGLIVPLQVGHGPALRLHQLLVELLQHF